MKAGWGISIRLAVVSATSFVGLAYGSLANVYMGQASAGVGDGSTCANALPYTFFNSAANWGSGSSQIGAGTTVHICGTIQGAAGATGLVFQGSGAAGNPVTLKFEPNASMQSPYWGTGGGGANGAIVATSVSYIVIDGGTNGFIENTLNGTAGGSCPGGTCTDQKDSNGIALTSCANCTVQNLLIENIYVHSSVSDEGGYGRGISKEGGATNLTINNVVIHDAGYCVFYDLTANTNDTNLLVENSDMSHCSTDVAVAGGNGSSATLAGFVFSGNKLHDAANWNDTAYNFHHDGVHIWSYKNTHITGIQEYNNQLYGDFGQGTAWFYFENYSSLTEDIQIFNNLFHETQTTCGFSCGPFSIWLQNDVSASITQAKIYNNTFAGGNDAMGGITDEGTTGIQMDIRNNLVQGYANLLQIQPGAPLPMSSSNYNDWYLTASNIINNEATGGYIASNFSAWRSLCSCDSGSTFGNPLLTASYHLTNSTSPAWRSGANLSALSIPLLDLDIFGVARPSAGAWDLGATCDSCSVGVPSPPAGLLVTGR